MLAAWTVIGSALSLLSAVRPRLLVVTSISSDTFDSEALRFRLRVLSDPKFSELFSSLNVVNVLGIRRTPYREYFNSLIEVLYHETYLIRAERVNTHTLFSMIYVAVFFDAVLRQFTVLLLQTFDFIRCSREERLVSLSF